MEKSGCPEYLFLDKRPGHPPNCGWKLEQERSTRFEGGFDTQKQYYLLSMIKAWNRKVDIMCIFSKYIWQKVESEIG